MYKTKKTKDGKIELWWNGETTISLLRVYGEIVFDIKLDGERL